MGAALAKALELIVSADRELCNILLVTAKMSLTSSVLALLIGTPFGIGLGAGSFRGRNVLLVINRTLMGMPPVVCGLFFYMLFSGVGPLGKFRLLFSVKAMILAQVTLITPIVIGTMESYVVTIAQPLRETSIGLGFGRCRTAVLLANECRYQIFSAYLVAFSRAIAEVGAVSMVGGAIAWKTNVMTTAIMQYTNRGDFSLGIALGSILLTVSFVVTVVISCIQRRVSK